MARMSRSGASAAKVRVRVAKAVFRLRPARPRQAPVKKCVTGYKLEGGPHLQRNWRIQDFAARQKSRRDAGATDSAAVRCLGRNGGAICRAAYDDCVPAAVHQAMPILRSILAVLAGYALFAASAVVLFRISGQDPH